MNIGHVISEGFGATLLMTGFVYCTSYITRERIKVVKILGTMLTNRTTPTRGLSDAGYVVLTGTGAHYLVGIFFSVIYNWIWDKKIMASDLSHCLYLGFLSGIIAVMVWKAFFAVHPNPPLVPLRLYLTVIFIAHIVFGAGIYLTKLILFQ